MTLRLREGPFQLLPLSPERLGPPLRLEQSSPAPARLPSSSRRRFPSPGSPATHPLSARFEAAAARTLEPGTGAVSDDRRLTGSRPRRAASRMRRGRRSPEPAAPPSAGRRRRDPEHCRRWRGPRGSKSRAASVCGVAACPPETRSSAAAFRAAATASRRARIAPGRSEEPERRRSAEARTAARTRGASNRSWLTAHAGTLGLFNALIGRPPAASPEARRCAASSFRAGTKSPGRSAKRRSSSASRSIRVPAMRQGLHGSETQGRFIFGLRGI